MNTVLDAAFAVWASYLTADAYEAADGAALEHFHAAEDEVIRAALDADDPDAYLPTLIAALGDARWGVRQGATYCLGEIRDVRAVQPLIDALAGAHDADDVRGIAAAVISIGTITVRPLIHALATSESVWVRRGTAYALAAFRDPISVPALVRALDEDDDAQTRALAASALATVRDARAVLPLTRALTDDAEAAVREVAARALGATAVLPAPAIRAAIAESLRAALKDSDWGTRQSAAEMLLTFIPDEAEALTLLAADLTHAEAPVRLGAAWSLLPVKDGRAVDALARLLLHSDAQIAASAAEALGQYGDKRAAGALIGALNHADAGVRHAAKAALDKLPK